MPTKKQPEPTLKDYKELLRDVQNAINGNGHDGLKVTVARIETSLIQMAEQMDREAALSAETRKNLNDYIKATADLASAVKLLDASVSSHHKKSILATW